VVEYFVQTSDTVKVKRSQLDRWMQSEDKAQEEWNLTGSKWINHIIFSRNIN
jgi:hypothetical protein